MGTTSAFCPVANLKVLKGTVDISMATIMFISMHMGPRRHGLLMPRVDNWLTTSWAGVYPET